jgi:hypothetical protein
VVHGQLQGFCSARSRRPEPLLLTWLQKLLRLLQNRIFNIVIIGWQMDMMNIVLQTYPVYYSSSILSIWHYVVPNWVDAPLYPGGTRTFIIPELAICLVVHSLSDFPCLPISGSCSETRKKQGISM